MSLIDEVTESADGHDDEERDETARRLLFERLRTVMEQERAMRSRIKLHARYITEDQRDYLARYLRNQRELTCMLIEDVSADSPDFSWPGEDW